MNNDDFLNKVEEVVDILKQSKSILLITGAGISAESGLPTYRGISGLYDNQNTEDGIRIEEALSGSTFTRKPELTWKYLSQMELACRGKSYNRAHEVIALMESRFERICVLTQNVDGFHHKAGSTNIIDIHGNLHDLYCRQCVYKETVNDYSNLETPPKCPNCGSIIRPDVVLFEEILSTVKTKQLSEEFQKGFDVVLSIGTTSVFPYIAQPVVNAYYAGIPTIEINPVQTRVSEFAQIKIKEKAGVSMNAIWMILNRD
ncbi:NAD-dependent protein deacylase [bacterium]|nr:NAD-dependent protein deacylase [bacterium]